MRPLTYIFLTLCFTPVIVQAAPPPLPDQHGGTGSLDELAGQPVLAIVVSGRKLRHIQRWEKALRADRPDLVSLRVADITDEPRPALEQVAGKLAGRAPDGVQILIDLNNLWATEYGLDTSEPCLLLFDADGRVTRSWRGRAKGPLVATVQSALSDLDGMPAGTAAP